MGQGVTATEGCANPCAAAKSADDDLSRQVTERAQHINAGGPVAGPQSYCQAQAKEMSAKAKQFDKYREALPAARAANETNRLGGLPDIKVEAPCLSRLPLDAAGLNKALGLPPKTITDGMLRDDDSGFRATLYRDETTGKVILTGRDTDPHSLADWQTNIDNGLGQDTEQYKEMRKLAKTLDDNGVTFNTAGYSKGGGLAQEAGLMAPDARVYVFNSAGLPAQALARTNRASFASLDARTSSFSAQDEFLTAMNNTTDHAGISDNMHYLYNQLSGTNTSWFQRLGIKKLVPLTLDYSGPSDMSGTGGFGDERQQFLDRLKGTIQNFDADPTAQNPFPPVRAGSFETIPNSMGSLGKVFGASRAGPGFGKLTQHLMTNVLKPMEDLVSKDRARMRSFLEVCR